MYNNIRGIKAFGFLLKRLLPKDAFRLMLGIYHKALALIEEPLSWYALWRVKRSIVKISKTNGPVRFGFYVVLSSMFHWRCVFELMLRDERFDPFIVVTPRIGWQIGDMEATLEKTYLALVREFGEKYVFKGYGQGAFDNHLKDCDACAMMNLYSGLAKRSFEVIHFALHGVPVFGSCYFYDHGTRQSVEYQSMRSLKFIRLFFCSNAREAEKIINYQNMPKGTDRVLVSGCPKADAITGECQVRTDGRKTILIAPHHSVVPTVDSGLCLGNFLRYKDFFLQLPVRYPDIDWIFRPHPHLRVNLLKNVGWSEGQWNEYIRRFIISENATFEDDGPYYESFRKSDAIIHDCGSFLPEYFYTGKPPCYLLASEEAKNYQFDSWGLSLIEHTYQAYREGDIVHFIEDVVIKGRDPMKEKRLEFAREKIMVNHPHASEYIVESIAAMFGRNKEDLL